MISNSTFFLFLYLFCVCVYVHVCYFVSKMYIENRRKGARRDSRAVIFSFSNRNVMDSGMN